MSASRLVELAAEFRPLNRRRLHGDPPLGALELHRWRELRDEIAYLLGDDPPIRGGVDRPLRVPSQLKVRYGATGENSAQLRNLSEAGLFIQTEATLPPETPLELVIDGGPEGPLLELEAVVIWRREIGNQDGPAGFGVEFRNLQADDLPGLVRLIERELEEPAAL